MWEDFIHYVFCTNYTIKIIVNSIKKKFKKKRDKMWQNQIGNILT